MATEVKPNTRTSDIQIALRLTYLTLAWMTIEAGASLWLGRTSHSLLLDGFGLDSIIELFSACVLLWRLQTEASGHADEAKIEHVEETASRWVGYTLYILAVGVVFGSVMGLMHHRIVDTHESVWGIFIGLTAKLGMPLLATAKLRVAARLNSKALRADAMEAITCGYLSIVLVIGLVATRAFNWWWLDSIAALVLVPFLIKEGRAAITGDCGCCSSDESCGEKS